MLEIARPARCARCHQTHLVKHDWYSRKVLYPDRCVPIWVRRFWCDYCHKAISMLPSFVHVYRHYGLAVIEQVLIKRFADAGEGAEPASRREVEALFEPSGAPSARTIWRWCGAYAAQAQAWLTAMLVALAMVKPEAESLDAHGAAHAAAAPQQVLWLARHLVAWLSGRVLDVPDHNDDSGTWSGLWCWGWNAGVGRLI